MTPLTFHTDDWTPREFVLLAESIQSVVQGSDGGALVTMQDGSTFCPKESYGYVRDEWLKVIKNG